MTKEGKCDTCRARKVRCDEVKPICGVCQKSQRHCQYRQGKPLSFEFVGARKREKLTAFADDVSFGPSKPRSTAAGVGLANATVSDTSSSGHTMMPVRTKQAGNGTFQVLALEPRPARRTRKMGDKPQCLEGVASLPREPSNASSARLCRWIDLVQGVSRGHDTNYFLGDWMMLVPGRLGCSDAVDASVDCFINSTIAYANPTPENLVARDVSNGKALHSMRQAISSKNSGSMYDSIVLAGSIIFLVQQLFIGGAGWSGYRSHQTAFSEMIQRSLKDGTIDKEIAGYFVFQCVSWDFLPAIYGDRNSRWDEPVWLEMRPPVDDSLNRTLSRVDLTANEDYLLLYHIKIPELIRLVRQARISTQDALARAAAYDLAVQLYGENRETLFRKLLDNGLVKINPTSTPDLQDYVPNSFDFKSNVIYYSYMTYWSNRLMVSGLILALLEIQPSMPILEPFAVSDIVDDEVITAQRIAMCTQYSWKRTATGIPFQLVSQTLPLLSAFFAWHRLEMRAGGASSIHDEARRARRMKLLCTSEYANIAKHWPFGTVSYERMEFMCGLMMGDPVVMSAIRPISSDRLFPRQSMKT